MQKTTYTYDQTIQILNHYFQPELAKKLTPAVAHGSDYISSALGCIAEAHLCNSVTKEEAQFAFKIVYDDLCSQIANAMDKTDSINENAVFDE